MTELLDISYFFENSRRFPWDIFFSGVPKVGSVHSYLCTILAPWGEEQYRELMTSHPTLSEIQRASKESPGVLGDIYSYCSQLNMLSQYERTDIAEEVLGFLSNHQGFKKHVQTTLDRKWRQGLILVPREVEPRD